MDASNTNVMAVGAVGMSVSISESMAVSQSLMSASIPQLMSGAFVMQTSDLIGLGTFLFLAGNFAVNLYRSWKQ